DAKLVHGTVHIQPSRLPGSLGRMLARRPLPRRRTGVSPGPSPRRERSDGNRRSRLVTLPVPMKARKLLENAALGPDQLRIVFEAFDGAWDVIRPGVVATPQAVEVARLRLANS